MSKKNVLMIIVSECFDLLELFFTGSLVFFFLMVLVWLVASYLEFLCQGLVLTFLVVLPLTYLCLKVVAFFYKKAKYIGPRTQIPSRDFSREYFWNL